MFFFSLYFCKIKTSYLIILFFSHIRRALDPSDTDSWTEQPTPLLACVCLALNLTRIFAGESVAVVEGTCSVLTEMTGSRSLSISSNGNQSNTAKNDISHTENTNIMSTICVKKEVSKARTRRKSKIKIKNIAIFLFFYLLIYYVVSIFF